VSGCASTYLGKKDDWTMFSIESFKVVALGNIVDESKFIVGEYWKKRDVNWNVQWAMDNGKFDKPTIYLKNGKDVFVSFCNDRYYAQYTANESGVFERFDFIYGWRDENKSSSDFDHLDKMINVSGMKFELKDSLMIIESLDEKLQYVFEIANQKGVQPRLGKKFDSAVPFALFPEESCKQEIFPTDSRF